MNEQNINEELISKLFISRHYDTANNYQPVYKGPVVDLVQAIARRAVLLGLTLSRWESNQDKWSKKITWALHKGPRPDQFRRLLDEDVVGAIYLTAPEGKTVNCAAYAALTGLLQALAALPEK